MLELRNLTKRYNRVTAVDGVNLTIERGEVYGYLGPNGSGKTTTVKMLTGLLEPTEGHIFYDGRDIRDDLVAYRRLLGYVPEEPWLYPYLSGLEYLQLVGRLRSIPESVLNCKVERLLDLFALHRHRYSPISSYSKGMKQKVLISAALLKANWIFQITDEGDGRTCLAAVRKAMLTLAVAPVFIATLAASLALWDASSALLTTAFGIMLSLILTEALLYSFRKIPSPAPASRAKRTCPRLPSPTGLPLRFTPTQPHRLSSGFCGTRSSGCSHLGSRSSSSSG